MPILNSSLKMHKTQENLAGKVSPFDFWRREENCVKGERKKTGTSLTYPSCNNFGPFQPVELELTMSKEQLFCGQAPPH